MWKRLMLMSNDFVAIESWVTGDYERPIQHHWRATLLSSLCYLRLCHANIFRYRNMRLFLQIQTRSVYFNRRAGMKHTLVHWHRLKYTFIYWHWPKHMPLSTDIDWNIHLSTDTDWNIPISSDTDWNIPLSSDTEMYFCSLTGYVIHVSTEKS